MWYANFYPNYIVTFGGFDRVTDTLPPEYQLPRENKVKGNLSTKSTLKMQKALTWLWLFSKKQYGWGKNEKRPFQFRLNFFTVTLSSEQKHSDDWIKIHMLEPLLKWMKRCGCKHYVWKAECQENGNIHFHITTNHFIHYIKFRDKWNSIQFKAGYLTNDDGTNNNLDPNSTDVHAVRAERRFVYYMTNYMSKTTNARKNFKMKPVMQWVKKGIEAELAMMAIAEGGFPNVTRQVEGKIWACSRELLNIKVQFNSEHPDFGDVLIDTQERLQGKWKKHDFCDTWRTKLISMNTKLHPTLTNALTEAYMQFHSK